ncbi:PSAP [Mytilus edulis]|uniref:PSAP n=1 Tax=Mytilus edulis TaxID=6550 RepID=A0A8S3U3N1_MYTED|nr:PSAP [Mytilus edulis]
MNWESWQDCIDCAKAEGVLTDICNRLTANADTCLAFVKDNIGKVFSKLSDGLDPEQICISLKVCPSLEQDFLTKVLPAPVSNDVLPVSNDVLSVSQDVIPNEINEITQDIGANFPMLRKTLNNKSEDAINATLEEICNELPGQLGALCQKFEPLLLKALVDEFSAEKACKAIKVCTAEDAFIVHEHVLSCKDCKEIMEGFAGETGIQVCLQMAGICGKSKTHIHHELTNSVEPENFEEPSGVAECTLCKFVMREVDNILSANKSEAAVNASLQQICNSLPDQLQGLCQQFAPILLIAIKNGLDPNMACTTIKLCNNEDDYDMVEKIEFDYDLVQKEALEKYEKEEEINAKASIGCTLCKFIIQEIDHFIVTNESSAAINATVYNLCSKLPAPLDKLCYGYAPVIVQDVVSGFDPELTCEKVKLCTNDSIAMTKDFPSSNIEEVMIKAGPECAICKLIVQEIDSFIAKNETASQINATVYAFCGKLPGPLTSLCMTYAPIIVNDVVLGFDPEKTCEKVKLCTNDSILLSPKSEAKKIEKKIKEKVEAGPECAICKLIVQEIDSFIAKNETASQINATVYAFCGKLPAPLTSLCMTYAPIIVNDVVLGFDPEKTCEKVKLCTNDKKVEASPGCTLCKFIVQAVSNYTTQNQSAAAINASVYQVCNELPALLKNLCQTYAPIIINDITAGFDPEQTCEKVKLCSNGSLSDESITLESIKELKNVKPSPGAVVTTASLMSTDQFHSTTNLTEETAHTSKKRKPRDEDMEDNTTAPATAPAPTTITIQEKNLAHFRTLRKLNIKFIRSIPKYTKSKTILQKEITNCHVANVMVLWSSLLPQKYNPEKFGNLICKAACPVARRRRSVDETPQIFLEFMKAAKMTKTWRCDLCEWIIEAINAYVQTNITEQSLEDYMNDICHFMPEPFKDECMKSVPEIIKELSHGFDEDVLCQHYIPDECNGSFVAALDKPVAAFFDDQKKDKDAQCEICKQIIKYIDGNLNHDKNEVKMYVDDVCERLPSPTNKACKSFAATEMEEILLKIINKILSPEDVCHMITVC